MPPSLRNAHWDLDGNHRIIGVSTGRVGSHAEMIAFDIKNQAR